MNPKDHPTPNEYARWPKHVQDHFDERIAIMREANKIPDNQTTPPEILQTATDEARALLK